MLSRGEPEAPVLHRGTHGGLIRMFSAIPAPDAAAGTIDG